MGMHSLRRIFSTSVVEATKGKRSFVSMETPVANVLPVVRQRSNWDCGVACIASVVTAARGDPVSLEDVCSALPTEAVRDQSVWSIDLAYGLKSLGVDNFLCTTISEGVDPSHESLGFYSKGFQEDTLRVNGLIRDAEKNSVRLERRLVPLDDLAEFVRVPGHKVIALVNSVDLEDSVFSCFQRYWTGGFVGHYIVVYGHCPASEGFLCMDPAGWNNQKFVKDSVFQRARQARGTDEDLIFVWPEGSSCQLKEPPDAFTGSACRHGSSEAAVLAADEAGAMSER